MQSSLFNTVLNNDGADYTTNANPVIAFGYLYSPNGNVVVAWSGLDPEALRVLINH